MWDCENVEIAVPLQREIKVNSLKYRVMRTMMMNLRMRMWCCCCCSKHMMRNEKEKRNQHIINIYNEQQQYEKISIPHSIVLRAAA
jgi:hypothetical protein